MIFAIPTALLNRLHSQYGKPTRIGASTTTVPENTRQKTVILIPVDRIDPQRQLASGSFIRYIALSRLADGSLAQIKFWYNKLSNKLVGPVGVTSHAVNQHGDILHAQQQQFLPAEQSQTVAENLLTQALEQIPEERAGQYMKHIVPRKH
jgi:hypothetical protein